MASSKNAPDDSGSPQIQYPNNSFDLNMTTTLPSHPRKPVDILLNEPDKSPVTSELHRPNETSRSALSDLLAEPTLLQWARSTDEDIPPEDSQQFMDRIDLTDGYVATEDSQHSIDPTETDDATEGATTGGPLNSTPRLFDLLLEDELWPMFLNLVQTRPEMLEPVIEEICRNNPALASLIAANPDEFLEMFTCDTQQTETLTYPHEEDEIINKVSIILLYYPCS
jgi:hypothetical protein